MRTPDAEEIIRKAKWPSVRAGTIDIGGIEVAGTVQCVHCGAHLYYLKGAEFATGWCQECHGPTCPNDACHKCVPFQKRLELFEQGKIRFLYDPEVP